MSERRSYLYSLEEIKARLQARAHDLARHLVPDGHLVGPNWMARNPLRNDHRAGSFSVNIRKGVWKDFAEGKGGDMLSFVATFATGGDYKKAVPWAKDFLGLTGRTPDKAERTKFEARQKEARDDEERRDAQRRKHAFALLCEARPLDGVDPASLYLKARGIDVAKLKEGIPRALRFHSRCKAWPEDTYHPAMLAFMSREDLPNGFAAVHRTYLSRTGGVWSKLERPIIDGERLNAKSILARCGGASIRLTKGESGKTLRHAPAGEWVSVTEGIENALTIARAQPGMRVIAAGSGSNLKNLVLPKQLGGLYLVADNDREGSPAAKQFAAAVASLSERHELAIVNMDGEFKDANDALMGKRRA